MTVLNDYCKYKSKICKLNTVCLRKLSMQKHINMAKTKKKMYHGQTKYNGQIQNL